jgi:hypothetical protein
VQRKEGSTVRWIALAVFALVIVVPAWGAEKDEDLKIISRPVYGIFLSAPSRGEVSKLLWDGDHKALWKKKIAPGSGDWAGFQFGFPGDPDYVYVDSVVIYTGSGEEAIKEFTVTLTVKKTKGIEKLKDTFVNKKRESRIVIPVKRSKVMRVEIDVFAPGVNWRKFDHMLRLREIEVYGRPNEEMLREEADRLRRAAAKAKRGAEGKARRKE